MTSDINSTSLKDRIDFFQKNFTKSEKTMGQISKEIDWRIRKIELYRYHFSILNEQELNLIGEIENKIDIEEEILAAICMAPKRFRISMIKKLQEIHNSSNPFDKLDDIIKNEATPHPLEQISNSFWIKVGNYILDYGKFDYPFNKNAAYFIRNIGYNGGYKNQSKKQKEYLKDLIRYESENLEVIRFFSNKELFKDKHRKDFQIINKYIQCL